MTPADALGIDEVMLGSGNEDEVRLSLRGVVSAVAKVQGRYGYEKPNHGAIHTRSLPRQSCGD